MTRVKRILNAFIYAGFFGMLANFLIECVIRLCFHLEYSHFTPEYLALFPTTSIAYGVDLILYGLIGATFSGMMFLYEIDQLGFIFQNILYYTTTAFVWILVVTFMWQLYLYKEALICTICGFVLADCIMTIVGYQTTKKQIEAINERVRSLN